MKSFANTGLRAVLMAGTLAGLAGCVTPMEPADAGAPPVPADETPAEDRLLTTAFVLGANTGFVGFDDAAAMNGLTAATLDLQLGQETVAAPRDAVVDDAGRLYILSTAAGGSVSIYENPLTATASRAPDRMIAGDATGITKSPTGIAIDEDNDLLYVASLLEGIVVFDISNPAVAGNLAPLRTFEVDLPLFRPEQIRFADGTLYVVDARGATSDVVAFDDPGSLSGPVTPDRMIECAAFDNTIGMMVDGFGRMLVGSRDAGLVLIFEEAAALDGVVQADVELAIAGTPSTSWPSFAVTDSEDRLYVSDASNNAVYVYDVASELTSGAELPDRVIDSEELIAPSRMTLFERFGQK